MADTALQDLVFPVACRHCAKQLHGKVRFCPYCGGEEAAFRAETVAAAAEPQRGTPARAAGPMPQSAMDATFAARPDLQPQAGFPAVLGPPDARGDDADTETVLLGPAAFEWPEGLPAVITVEPRPPKPRLAALLAKPAAIGAALVLSVLALVLGPLLTGQRGEPARPQAAAKPEPASITPGRADPGTARGEPGALAAAAPGQAGPQALPGELDRREREQAAGREQPREAGQKAARALGLDELSAPAPPAPPVTGTRDASSPAPETAVPAPTAACSEALAALALCQPDTAQAPAR